MRNRNCTCHRRSNQKPEGWNDSRVTGTTSEAFDVMEDAVDAFRQRLEDACFDVEPGSLITAEDIRPIIESFDMSKGRRCA